MSFPNQGIVVYEIFHSSSNILSDLIRFGFFYVPVESRDWLAECRTKPGCSAAVTQNVVPWAVIN